MSLRLVIESAPQGQPLSERVFDGGRLVIGRSDEADWQLHDPDMFVSRQHCILTEEGGQPLVTDASSGGLFIDNAANPVGLGNSVPLEAGMRLRMGDFVMRVETVSAHPPDPVPSQQRGGMNFDFSFDEGEDVTPEPAERPETLPDPFGLSRDSRVHQRRAEPQPPKPLDQDDPFGLDLRKPSEEPVPDAATDRDLTGGGSGAGYFGLDDDGPSIQHQSEPVEPDVKKDVFAAWDNDSPSLPQSPPSEPDTLSCTPEPDTDTMRAKTDTRADEDLYQALFRGMGVDLQQVEGDPVQQMEQIGKSMRALIEGVMLLLRTRAQAKQKARVAQTIIASADVNPLKFLATPEDALAAMIAPRGKSYLEADAAVHEAFRDLTDHQLRTWAALQTALRRMIDRFDPEEIEKVMEDVGLLESLIAGGRNAKLWQLYQDRYREIAQSAEQEFLGEVGADFRDAYENERKG